MSDGFTVDLRDFSECLREVQTLTNKDSAVLLNRAGYNATKETYNATQKGSASKIRSDLKTVLSHTRTIEFASGKVSSRVGHGQRAYLIVQARARKAGKTLTKKEAGVEARRMIASRARSGNYLRIAVALAGKAFGAFSQMRTPKGWASEGKGKKAMPGLAPEASLQITVPAGAEKRIPLETGINKAGEEMLQHAQTRMAERLANASGR